MEQFLDKAVTRRSQEILSSVDSTAPDNGSSFVLTPLLGGPGQTPLLHRSSAANRGREIEELASRLLEKHLVRIENDSDEEVSETSGDTQRYAAEPPTSLSLEGTASTPIQFETAQQRRYRARNVAAMAAMRRERDRIRAYAKRKTTREKYVEDRISSLVEHHNESFDVAIAQKRPRSRIRPFVERGKQEFRNAAGARHHVCLQVDCYKSTRRC
jgi:hypothetical protein